MTFKTSVSAYALAMALASTAYAGSVAAQNKGPLQASVAEADTRTFEIEEQAVETALQRFAEQSGFQMAWLANDASMLNAKAVKGDYTPSAAMQILLDGTGLEFRQIDEKTIAVLTRSAQKDSQNGQDERWTRLASASGARMAGMAQATGAGQPQGAGAAQADQQMIEEVVVTGSRIRRSGTATPIPVTMLDARAIALSGDARLADTLNNLPAIGATQTLANSNDNPQEAGTNFLNLRRLGIDRTLVLVNGRRHVGSRPGTTAVDVNTIPTAMVERVEVITGGASAVYGADAVSGVVNLIMRDDFQGLKLDGQVGITDEGDGESYQLSLTAGTNFDDGRGNIYFNTSYDKTRSINALDRGYASQNLRFASNPANGGPNDGVPDQILFENTGFIGTPAGGRVVAPDTLGLFEADGGPFTFDQNGNLISQTLGQLPEPFLSQGGDFVDLSAFDLLQVPIERLIVSTGMHYDLHEKVTLFANAKYAQSESATAGQPTFTLPTFSPIFLTADNPFIPQELSTILANNGADGFFVSRTNVDQGQRRSRSDRDTIQLEIGFEGDINPNLDYTVHYQYGRSDNTTEFQNEQILSRFNQQLDAVRDAGGNIVCRDQSNGCVPLNVLGPNAATADALAFSHVDFLTEGRLTQQVVNATITGDTAGFIDLPAGALGFALGTEYRKESAETEEGFLRNSGDVFPGGPIEDVAGSFDVWEAFGEISVPVLRGVPFAEEVNLEAAVRFADYSTIGSATTWKVGGDWAPISDIRFRAVVSQAVRAPNIGELFAPTRLANVFLEDPCDSSNLQAGAPSRAANCAALGLPADFISNAGAVTTRVLTGGNENLKEETADTLTFGAVLTPRMIPGFSLTVDYWNIEIDDAVNSFPVQAVANNCVDAESIDNPFCESITRRADGNFESISSQLINVASLEAAGIDIEAKYFMDLGAVTNNAVPGTLDLNLVATYLDKLNFFAQEGQAVPDREAGELGDPEWTVNLRGTYELGDLTFSLFQRFISSQRLDLAESPEFRDPNSTGSEWYTDLQVRYRLADLTEVYFGVDNVFDNAPPPLARVPETRSFGDDAVVFDQIGRFFYAGVTVQF
ncbi:TonB-dependent receptor [Iodidimonas sp. MBR-22]|nr:TonB-dependent receptor [Iodidimonas sp. MBR-22]